MINEAQLIVGGTISLWILYMLLWRKSCKEYFDWFASIFLNFFVALLTVAGFIQLDQKKVDENYYHSYYIYSLKNQEKIQGDFYLGSGSIEQVEYYYFYWKDVNGFYNRGQEEVNKTVIEESDTCRPHTEVLNYKYISRTSLVSVYGEEEQERYKIVVPRGTIINNFEVR